MGPHSEGLNFCPPTRLWRWRRHRGPYHCSAVFWRGHTGTTSVDLLFAFVMPPFCPLPYAFLTKLISYCSSPHKWNCSHCGPLPLFMLAKTSRYWQANLDGIHTKRGQGGKKGHTVALSAFAFLAQSMPMDRGRGSHRWGESSPSCSGDWTGSERHLRSCQVSLGPVRPSLWKSLSWPQKVSSIYLTTLLNTLCCPSCLVKKRSCSQVQNVCWNRDISSFKIHGHA